MIVYGKEKGGGGGGEAMLNVLMSVVLAGYKTSVSRAHLKKRAL